MLCRKGLPGCCSDLSIHYNNSVHLTFNVTIWPLFPQSASFPIAIGKPSSVTVYPRVSLGLPRSPIRLPRDAAVPPTHSLFPYKHISSKPFHGTQAPGGFSGLTLSLSIHFHHLLWKFWHFHLIYHGPFLFPCL